MKTKGLIYGLVFSLILLLGIGVTNASGSWVTTTIDSDGWVGEYTSIAVDSNNKVHISYYDRTNEDLKYSTNASGSWITSMIDGVAGYAGSYTSIAVDSNDNVHISYYAGVLKYATNASGIWATTTVDSGTAGMYTSIAIDSNNNVHISYYESVNSALKYATNASGIWVTTTVDSDGYVGNYTSIAIDSDNKAHISYFDGGPNYNLKYATNASGSWFTTTVDSDGYVGSNTSIAIDSNNKVHISYRDDINSDLKYTTNASGSWISSAIDSAGNMGYNTSITIDLNNKVHISYRDATNGDLKYTTNASGSWISSAIDSAGIVGLDTSIAIDLLNNVHISYYDYTNNNLKYATNAPDNDGDGYTVNIDCNDNDASVNPGVTEGPFGNATCTDGKDNDCDGLTDSADLNCEAMCNDNDNDGYAVEGGTCGVVDCDDNDATVNPGVSETPYNGKDDDCNSATKDDDFDGDGYGIATDCNDNNALVNPGATEVLNNGIDDDCNSFTCDTINADLYVSSLSAPSLANAGQSISVSDTTNKSGLCNASASTTKIYFSTDNKWWTNDTYLGSRAVPAFGAGAQSSSGSTDVTIPTNTCTKTYYLIARADANGNVSEWNEGNNNRVISIAITRPDPSADLYVSNVTAPVSANAGDTITVTDTTNKSGCAAGASTTRVYLSKYANGYAGIEIGSGRAVPAFTSNPGAQTNSGSTIGTIPSGGCTGSCYIVVKADADGAITEWNEGNNKKATPITITSP